MPTQVHDEVLTQYRGCMKSASPFSPCPSALTFLLVTRSCSPPFPLVSCGSSLDQTYLYALPPTSALGPLRSHHEVKKHGSRDYHPRSSYCTQSDPASLLCHLAPLKEPLVLGLGVQRG